MALLSTAGPVAIDTMLPAFGAMREAFNLPPDSTRLSLTLTLYFLGTGAGLFVAGPLADAIGRRRVMVFSLTLYGLGALGAAVAPNLAVLLASRFAWGFASAGPRILSQAILRDRYDGQELARAMTMVMTFFYVGPILGPVIGKAILDVAGWRWVFGASVLFAAAMTAWGVARLPESLAEANRRPFSLRTTAGGLRRAAAHPVTRSYSLVVVFGFGAFFSFLGSSELIISEIYERPELFVWLFATYSAGMAVMAFIANRTLRTVAAHNWTLGAGAVFLVASVVLLMASLASGGQPPLMLFIALFGAAILGFAAVFPTANSIALHPMGELAGTAAAGMGAASTLLSAGLAWLIDRSISGSVTPLAVGYTVYAAISLGFQLAGRKEVGR